MALDTLGAGPMSSDDSDTDDLGNSVYRAKIVPWRGKEMVRKLMDIDHDRNTTNAYGNTRAGNPPRVRRRQDGRETLRKAIPGLPLNFYDPNWSENGTCSKRVKATVIETTLV
ncbi:hypothetical protein BYT27DRAFT_7208933 [Phlegmacium glaucopus]|nr:hypothetical protein BYT27DRAFT_7208933 [Phlegmacium glaucopus]